MRGPVGARCFLFLRWSGVVSMEWDGGGGWEKVLRFCCIHVSPDIPLSPEKIKYSHDSTWT
jgi:hypothetical protein